MADPRKSARPWMIGFGLVAAGLLVYLLVAPNPADAARETADRIAEGKRHRPEADFVAGLWWAALINLVLALGLMAGAKCWARRLGPIEAPRGFARTRWGRGFLLALTGIVVLGGSMRWNLAHRSLWWDELWAVKFGVVGYYIGDSTKPLEERYFGEGSWQRALWHYTRPINHSAASFPARLSHVVWRGFAKPDQPHLFHDFAVRFPNWVASLVSIALVGMVGALWGRPVAGILSALFLALHPWHMRYGIDLRGYSSVVLGTVGALFWLTLIFRQGKARWFAWWGFGLNQALLVWAFPHAAFVAAGMAAAAVVLIFRVWDQKADRISALLRWLLVNTVAAMIYLGLFGPNLLQMSRWVSEVYENHSGHGLDGPLMRESVSQLITGVPWSWGTGEYARGLADLSERFGGMGILVICLLVAAAIAGWLRLVRGTPSAALMLFFLWLPGVALVLLFYSNQHFYYPRYLTFLLVPLVLMWGVLTDWVTGQRRWVVLGAAALLFFFGWVAKPQWDVLMARPYSPMRDVAEVFEEVRSTREGPVIFVCYGHGEEMLPRYFPELRGAVSLAEMEALMEEAREANADLVVAYGHPTFNRHQVPDGFSLLDDPAQFDRVRVLRGIVPDHTYTILDWKNDR